MGRFFGISVRVHFTFLLFAFYQLAHSSGSFTMGLIQIVGLYLSVLLHEFGHSLAARWCDGDADEIILWPLGGLAFCRPLFNPTAHLITGAAGPLVSFMLVVVFFGLSRVTGLLGSWWIEAAVHYMLFANVVLLIFNLIPAFPMDGGRVLRDILWHWLGVDRATKVAVAISRMITIAAIIFGIVIQDYRLAVLALFIFFSASAEQVAIGYEGTVRPFSIRERIRRGIRQRAFRMAVKSRETGESAEGFHRCAVCGRTELGAPDLVFRVAADGEEYCGEHLPKRK